MGLRKDDPIYYKNEIAKLVKEARKNGLIVYMPKGEKYICFKSPVTEEVGTSYIPWLFKDGDINDK